MLERATAIESFSVRMFFSRRPTRAAVVELERDALRKLLHDVEASGCDPLAATFRTVWRDQLNGTAYLAGSRRMIRER